MEDVRAELRRDPSPATLAWVAECVGARARVDGWMLLEGGSACAIHGVDVLDARGVRQSLVLKRFFRRDWVAREPDLAAREARHLEWLAGLALPIPQLVGVDPEPVCCDHPAVLMTRLPGRSLVEPSDPEPWLRTLVSPLPVLHTLGTECAARFSAYRSYVDLDALEPPSWSRQPQVWQRAIDCVRGQPPRLVARFVHRDYHPTNLLWTRGQVSGVLDFTDSSFGPAQCDLGHCGLNLAQLRGAEAAERFKQLYQSAAPGLLELDPYWDLLSLVEILPGPDGVYWGWLNLGVSGLSTQIVRARLDDYVSRLVAELG